MSKPKGKRHIPKQERSRSLVQAVVEGAIQVLVGTDREDVSINRIARRAGVGIGSVYRYFESRDGVLNAVVDRITEENFRRFERLLEAHADEPLETLAAAILGELTSAYAATPALTRASVSTILRYGRAAEITRERDRVVELLAARLAGECGVPMAEARASARAFADMAMGIAISEIYRDADSEQNERAWATVRRAFAAELAHLRGDG